MNSLKSISIPAQFVKFGDSFNDYHGFEFEVISKEINNKNVIIHALRKNGGAMTRIIKKGEKIRINYEQSELA